MGKKAKLEVTGETHKWRVGKKASSAKAARNFPALGDSGRGGQKCPRLPAINPERHGESQPCTWHERSANPGPQKGEIQPQVKPNACRLQLSLLPSLPQLQAVCW